MSDRLARHRQKHRQCRFLPDRRNGPAGPAPWRSWLPTHLTGCRARGRGAPEARERTGSAWPQPYHAPAPPPSDIPWNDMQQVFHKHVGWVLSKLLPRLSRCFRGTCLFHAQRAGFPTQRTRRQQNPPFPFFEYAPDLPGQPGHQVWKALFRYLGEVPLPNGRNRGRSGACAGRGHAIQSTAVLPATSVHVSHVPLWTLHGGGRNACQRACAAACVPVVVSGRATSMASCVPASMRMAEPVGDVLRAFHPSSPSRNLARFSARTAEFHAPTNPWRQNAVPLRIGKCLSGREATQTMASGQPLNYGAASRPPVWVSRSSGRPCGDPFGRTGGRGRA